MKKKLAALQARLQQSRLRKHIALMSAAAALTILSANALAFTAPAAGSLAYDFYDVVVTQGLQGAIGFTIGVLFIGYGATKVLTQWPIALFAVLAGTMLVKADGILVSLGAMV